MALAMAAVPIAAQGIHGSEGENFLKALTEGDAAKAVPLIEEPGSRVASYRGLSGDTALHIVTRKRNLNWVGYLLNKGGDPNVGDRKGDTPLMIAARIGFPEAAEYLLRYGARVDATNRLGETPLNIAVQSRQPRVVELLLRAGADPDKADHAAGLTPRDYAKRDARNPGLLKLIETVKSTKKAVAGPKLN